MIKSHPSFSIITKMRPNSQKSTSKIKMPQLSRKKLNAFTNSLTFVAKSLENIFSLQTKLTFMNLKISEKDP
jgi:hypothetical protein